MVRPTQRLRELIDDILKELIAVVNTSPIPLRFGEHTFPRTADAGGRDVAMVGGQVDDEALLLKTHEQLVQVAL